MTARPPAWAPEGRVGLADLVRSLVRLHVGDEETRRVIAGLLGLDVAPHPGGTPAGDEQLEGGRPAPEPDPPDGETANAVEARLDEVADALQEAEPAVRSREEAMAEPDDEDPGPVLDDAVDELPRLARVEPSPPTGGARMARLPPVEGVHLQPLPHVPLLDPRRERAVVTALATVWALRGEVDIPLLVERCGRGVPLRSLPRQLRGAAAPEVEVLVDVSAGMAPFRRDAAAFVEAARRTLGRHAVTVRRFHDCPGRDAGLGADGDAVPTRTPTGTPLIVLTHLGLGGPVRDHGRSRASDWAAFARAAAHAGLPVVALVPWPLEEMPPQLRAAVPVVPWDRPTGPRDVFRALRGPGPGRG